MLAKFGRQISPLCAALLLYRCACVTADADSVSPQIRALAAQYVAAYASVKRLAHQLDNCGCDPESVVRALRPAPAKDAKPGYYDAEHFRSPELLKRHPDDLLFCVVPESYRPETPTGLIVLMHGGGKNSPRTHPRRYMRMHDKTGWALGDAFYRSGMVAVGPSAPLRKTNVRWCVPEADDYLCDVILECEARFNIDPNRVVLMGYSMGGFGAMHQVQRQPDRFAVVLAGAGAWSLAYWPVIHGTPLWIVQGAHDAVYGKRGHDTDVQYARWADKLLTAQGLPHEYVEHNGGHDPRDAHKALCGFIERAASVRRDPYYPHVVCVTPRGWTPRMKYPAPHNRWVSILETIAGPITYDHLVHVALPQTAKTPRQKWEAWRLTNRPQQYPGALVDVTNRGNNNFLAITRNVKRFALWLHPKMVDFANPVRVVVNGQLAFQALATPSVSAALRSFVRRRDWGLIYSAEIVVSVPGQTKE